MFLHLFLSSNVSQDDKTPLCLAIEARDMECVKLLLSGRRHGGSGGQLHRSISERDPHNGPLVRASDSNRSTWSSCRKR